ncbi:MAG: hypothetical protein AB8G26_14250, partial [Ilumatobacter sp.]
MSISEPIARAPRAWHVSERLVPGAPDDRGADGSTEDSDETVGDDASVSDGSERELAPLWHRIITGQSFIWRLKAARNRVRWKRRHLARGVLRWLELHPEVRTAARHGQVTRFAVRAVAQRRRPPAPTQTREFRPPVRIAAQLDLDSDLQHLSSVVALTTSTAPDLEVRAHPDDSGVVVV